MLPQSCCMERLPVHDYPERCSTKSPNCTAIKNRPGAKLTGLALVNDSTSEVVWTAELEPRGFQIRDALTKRRQLRRGRRNRKTQYHQPRFDNGKRPTSWLPPSLQSRVENRVTWVLRLQKLTSISSDISQELVKFDTQLTLVKSPSKNPVHLI